ncbi:hypothetical protein [Nocardia sp. NPDC050406]|uniref:hypothetical protein n=1 Tax=Nocardia sp. NPDC050406 TaxID=3364318 RepID=UPI0037BD0DA6
MALRERLQPTPVVNRRLLIAVTATATALGAAALLITGTGPGFARNNNHIPCPEPAALEIWTGGVHDLPTAGPVQFAV